MKVTVQKAISVNFWAIFIYNRTSFCDKIHNKRVYNDEELSYSCTYYSICEQVARICMYNQKFTSINTRIYMLFLN